MLVKTIIVQIAFISGVIPLLTTDHIYIGNVLSLPVRKNVTGISSKDKVIIVDDLIATGGTAEAAAKLVEKSGGEVSGFIFVINLFDLGGADKLIKNGYKIVILIEFPVEVQTDLVYDKSQLIIIRNHRLICEYISHTIL